ncbi:hypothetical protein HDU91_002339 [Kappamyces sp. JEL0680]|nr:hypothetical protein HDU91_002339 [Kappamyces sp. JEL0680]
MTFQTFPLAQDSSTFVLTYTGSFASTQEQACVAVNPALQYCKVRGTGHCLILAEKRKDLLGDLYPGAAFETVPIEIRSIKRDGAMVEIPILVTPGKKLIGMVCRDLNGNEVSIQSAPIFLGSSGSGIALVVDLKHDDGRFSSIISQIPPQCLVRTYEPTRQVGVYLPLVRHDPAAYECGFLLFTHNLKALVSGKEISLFVNPALEYVRLMEYESGKRFYMAKNRLDLLFLDPEHSQLKDQFFVLSSLPGRELIGMDYHASFRDSEVVLRIQSSERVSGFIGSGVEYF